MSVFQSGVCMCHVWTNKNYLDNPHPCLRWSWDEKHLQQKQRTKPRWGSSTSCWFAVSHPFSDLAVDILCIKIAAFIQSIWLYTITSNRFFFNESSRRMLIFSAFSGYNNNYRLSWFMQYTLKRIYWLRSMNGLK